MEVCKTCLHFLKNNNNNDKTKKKSENKIEDMTDGKWGEGGGCFVWAKGFVYIDYFSTLHIAES